MIENTLMATEVDLGKDMADSDKGDPAPSMATKRSFPVTRLGSGPTEAYLELIMSGENRLASVNSKGERIMNT